MSTLQIFTKGCRAIAGEGATLSVLGESVDKHGEVAQAVIAEIALPPGPVRYAEYAGFAHSGQTLGLTGCLIQREPGRAYVMRSTDPVESGANPDHTPLAADPVRQLMRTVERLSADVKSANRRSEHIEKRQAERDARAKAEAQAAADAKAKAEAEAKAEEPETPAQTGDGEAA